MSSSSASCDGHANDSNEHVRTSLRGACTGLCIEGASSREASLREALSLTLVMVIVTSIAGCGGSTTATGPPTDSPACTTPTELTSVGEPSKAFAVSSDGCQMAAVIRRADGSEALDLFAINGTHLLTLSPQPGKYAYAPASDLFAYVDDDDPVARGKLLLRDAGGRGTPRDMAYGVLDFEITSDGQWLVYRTGDPYGRVAAEALGGDVSPHELSERARPLPARGSTYGTDASRGYYQSAGWDGTGGVTLLEDSKQTIWLSLTEQRETLIEIDTIWPTLMTHHPLARLVAYASAGLSGGIVQWVRSLDGGATTQLPWMDGSDAVPTRMDLRFTPNGSRLVLFWLGAPPECPLPPSPCPPISGAIIVFSLSPTPTAEINVSCSTDCWGLPPLDTGVLFIKSGELRFISFGGSEEVLEAHVGQTIYRIDKTRWVYNVPTGDASMPLELRLLDLSDAGRPVARALGGLELADRQFSGAGLELLPGEPVRWLVVRDSVGQRWGLYDIDADRLISTPYTDWRPLRVVADRAVIYGRVKTSTDDGSPLQLAELGVGPLP